MNKYNKDIFINILSSVLFVLMNTFVLFYVYRIANSHLGIELIGLWSVITAITSIGNIGTFGFSGSLVKYAAELKSRNQLTDIIGILNSSILIMSALLIIFLGFIYIGTLLFLHLIIDIKYLEAAFQLIPFSFVVFFISSIAYLVLSVIEGMNKNWQKNCVLIFSSIILLIIVFPLIEKFGIVGLFYAQIIHATSIFLFSFVLICVNIQRYRAYIFTWNLTSLKEVIQYGIKFQFVSILQAVADPVTKFFLSRYGGLGIVGLFEMGSRLVIQTRVLLSSVTMNLLPKLVDVHITRTTEQVQNLFVRIFRINYDLFAVTFGMLFLFSPIVLKFWLGEINLELVFIIRVLTIAWFINSIMIVPYVYNLSSGVLRGNIISHALIAFLNIIFGFFIVVFKGPALLFIYGWSLALVLGSLFILTEYVKRRKIEYTTIFSLRDTMILLIIFLNLVILYACLHVQDLNSNTAYIVCGLIYLITAIIYFRKSESMMFFYEYMASFSRLFNKVEK